MKTKHREGCNRVFKSYDPNCPRCRELMSGATPRTGWSDLKRRNEERTAHYIKAHNCEQRNCGPVCTFGDW